MWQIIAGLLLICNIVLGSLYVNILFKDNIVTKTPSRVKHVVSICKDSGGSPAWRFECTMPVSYLTEIEK